MTNRDSDLFHDILNTINEHNQRQTHCFSLLFSNYFEGVIRKVLQ